MYCKIAKEEKEAITKAILKQKIGNNPKAEKTYAEYASRKQDPATIPGEKILLKYARVATGIAVRWKRVLKKTEESERIEGYGQAIEYEKVAYSTRLLACTRCGAQQESKWMQLRVKEGFRAIRCTQCGPQERTTRNMCQCKVVWRQCVVHRIDPPAHRSKKVAKRKMKKTRKRVP